MPTVENQQSYFTSRYFYMQATYLFCIIQEAPIKRFYSPFTAPNKSNSLIFRNPLNRHFSIFLGIITIQQSLINS